MKRRDLIVLGLLITFIFLIFLHRNHAVKHQDQVVVTSQLVTIHKRLLTITADAEIKATHYVSLHVETNGLINELHCSTDHTVHAGDVIIRLRADDLDAQLQFANASLHKDTLNYSRRKQLLHSHYISQAELDALQNTLDQDSALVKEIQAKISKTLIVAPFDGHIGICTLNVGSYINAGTTISTLESNGEMLADFYIPENKVAMIHLSQPLTLTTSAYPALTFSGKVTSIDNAINSDTRSLHVQATIANPQDKLLTGMAAQVILDIGSKDQIDIPQTALNYDPDGAGVFVISSDHSVHRKTVRLGMHQGELVEVINGLKTNVTIVTLGQQNLYDGEVVKVSTSSEEITP